MLNQSSQQTRRLTDPTGSGFLGLRASGIGLATEASLARKFVLLAPAGCTREHLEDVEFWRPIASRFSAFDEIAVRGAGNEFLARVVVTRVKGSELGVLVAAFLDFTNGAGALS